MILKLTTLAVLIFRNKVSQSGYCLPVYYKTGKFEVMAVKWLGSSVAFDLNPSRTKIFTCRVLVHVFADPTVTLTQASCWPYEYSAN